MVAVRFKSPVGERKRDNLSDRVLFESSLFCTGLTFSKPHVQNLLLMYKDGVDSNGKTPTVYLDNNCFLEGKSKLTSAWCL